MTEVGLGEPLELPEGGGWDSHRRFGEERARIAGGNGEAIGPLSSQPVLCHENWPLDRCSAILVFEWCLIFCLRAFKIHRPLSVILQ